MVDDGPRRPARRHHPHYPHIARLVILGHVIVAATSNRFTFPALYTPSRLRSDVQTGFAAPSPCFRFVPAPPHGLAMALQTVPRNVRFGCGTILFVAQPTPEQPHQSSQSRSPSSSGGVMNPKVRVSERYSTLPDVVYVPVSRRLRSLAGYQYRRREINRRLESTYSSRARSPRLARKNPLGFVTHRQQAAWPAP